MEMAAFPFETVDWESVEPTRHPGETGEATWRTRRFGSIRVRRVDYSPGYRADHWCLKGHVLFCLSGELQTELADGRSVVLKPGMSYQVGDNAMAHRSVSPAGASLFIVD
jgi:quercetin dioxygenase-like cupin family protein